jgi:G6PDH family F420-dependent oxidoreductase
MSIADAPGRARLEVGYWLSSEEHGPRALVGLARDAEAAGFRHAMISDHFHPWIPAQGHAPFVWGVLGAIATTTSQLHLATGVSAPVARVHPVVLAQAAATASLLLDGRFALGVGTGERLNEHVTGAAWPRAAIRREILAEAVDIVRRLLAGGEVTVDGTWHSVEQATLFSRPADPLPIWIAASGPRSAELAGRLGDGLIGVAADASLVEGFEAAGGVGKDRVAQLHVCWSHDRASAAETVLRWWPQGGLPPRLLAELTRPADVAEACTLVDARRAAAGVVTGPDPDDYLVALARFAAAGFTRVYVHQIGPDQRGWFELWQRHLAPALGG